MPQWLHRRDICCNLHSSLLLVHLIGNSIQHIGYHNNYRMAVSSNGFVDRNRHESVCVVVAGVLKYTKGCLLSGGTARPKN
jgi:hypothetical protein